jgi:hypothetical protein
MPLPVLPIQVPGGCLHLAPYVAVCQQVQWFPALRLAVSLLGSNCIFAAVYQLLSQLMIRADVILAAIK